MKKIAVLGPSGTYSDVAAKAYLKNINEDYEIVYYPTIIKAIDAISDDTIAIVPFENSLDGFIIETMDRIILKNLNIESQLKLSIDFAFCANVNDINDVKEVYCQFKSYGQCLDFILDKSFNVIKTESNIESLNKLNSSKPGFGAIVPMHAVKNLSFPIKIEHIADSKNNETRFFVLSNKKELNEIDDHIEASVVFKGIKDRPGILYEILKIFHDANINLKSIISRPDKTGMGNYNFYMECSLTKNEKNSFIDILNNYENDSNFKLEILGVYESIGD